MATETDEWEDLKPKYKEIWIEVTPSHIARAVPKNVYRDPVSLAIQEHFQAKAVMSGWGYCHVFFDNLKVSYSLSPQKVLATFIRDFDNGKKVSPIRIQLFKDKEVDTTPKYSNRKPRQTKNFTDIQIAAQKAQRKLEL